MKKFLLTIIAILFLFFSFLFYGGKLFTEMSINDTVESLRDSINFSQKQIFDHDTLKDQPELIINYFNKVVSDNVQKPKFIRVKQEAEFKTDLNSDWFPMSSEQYYTAVEPNFLWDSKIETSRYFWVSAIESYINGKGNTLIKFNSSITVADSWGIELDKSGLFRYISEAVLFPTQLLPSKYLIWNILDSNKAEIKFIDGKISVVAKLFFNDDYTISKIETYDKYRAVENGYQKSLYTVYFYDYKSVHHSFLIPTYMETVWDLPSGPFKYGKFSITEVKYE